MINLRTFALPVVFAHWIVAIGHLLLAAQVLPVPNNHVSGLALVLITSGHFVVSLALWKLGDRAAGLVLLVFFCAALGADVYEHFLHASLNNVFMVAPSGWAAWFNTSVFVLLALETVGCSLGMRSLGGRSHPTAA